MILTIESLAARRRKKTAGPHRSPQPIAADRWARPKLVAGLAAAVALVVTLPGCIQTRVVDDSFEFYKELARKQDRAAGPASGSDNPLAAGPTQWTVRVASFSGPAKQQRAHDLMRRLTREADQTGLWLSNLGNATTLYKGQFDEASSPQAQKALREIRRLRLSTGRRFPNAQLVTVNRRDKQIQDRHNLRAYSGYYTLQVAYYDGDWQGRRRKAAERNARKLREATDVTAYYYHGKNLSMVTVGLFGKEQAFEMRPDPISPGRAKVRAYSPQVVSLRERFPYNYANKGDVAQRFANDEASDDTQRSKLVRVP